MKRWNVNYDKKLKRWSNEAFNAGKRIEAMKRLTLHRIASSLHCFIASSLLLPSFGNITPPHLRRKLLYTVMLLGCWIGCKKPEKREPCLLHPERRSLIPRHIFHGSLCHSRSWPGSWVQRWCFPCTSSPSTMSQLHRWAPSPISVISDIGLSLISELPISDWESGVRHYIGYRNKLLSDIRYPISDISIFTDRHNSLVL